MHLTAVAISEPPPSRYEKSVSEAAVALKLLARRTADDKCGLFAGSICSVALVAVIYLSSRRPVGRPAGFSAGK